MSADIIQDRDYFVTWVQFAICNALGGAVAGAVAGGLVGVFLGPHHVDPKIFMLATGGAGFVASLPVSYLFFRFFVSRLWFRMHTRSARIPPLPVNAA
jgi:putative flippase GtrA